MSLEKAIELYKAYLEHSNRAVGTRKSNQTWLAPFLEFCSSKGVTKLEELDSEVLAAYRKHLFWTPGKRGVLYSQNTLFQAQRMVRAFLTWCFQTELVWKNLTEGWVLRRPPDPPRNVPTVAEISRLMSVPDLTTSLGVRNRALLELLYGTGIRAEECFKLNLDSVDLENSRLVVHGKGNKFRALPLGPHLRQCLTRYLEVRDSFGVESAEEALFVSPSSRARLGQGSIGIIVRESAITAGLGSFGPHTLRHSFATHLLESGADVAYIQALLGHAKIVTTETYTRVRPLELLKEHRRTHPRAMRSECFSAKRKRKGSKASDGE